MVVGVAIGFVLYGAPPIWQLMAGVVVAAVAVLTATRVGPMSVVGLASTAGILILATVVVPLGIIFWNYFRNLRIIETSGMPDLIRLASSISPWLIADVVLALVAPVLFLHLLSYWRSTGT